MPNYNPPKTRQTNNRAGGVTKTRHSAVPNIPPPVSSNGPAKATPNRAGGVNRPGPQTTPKPTKGVTQPAPKIVSPSRQSAALDYDDDYDDDYEEADTRHSYSSSVARRESRQPSGFVRGAANLGGWLVRGRPVSRHSGHSVTTAERGVYALGGLALIAFSSYLTTLFMSDNFPVFKTLPGQGPTQGALIVGTATTILFMLVEIFIWRGYHSPVVWFICAAFMALDITMNVGGCMKLFGMKSLTLWPPTSLAGWLVVAVGVGVAIIPERFIAAGLKS